MRCSGGGRSFASSPWQTRQTPKNARQVQRRDEPKRLGRVGQERQHDEQNQDRRERARPRGATQSGQRAKTRMKLSRYSASGTTHNSGTGARSVETCVVTPSSRLDGSAARTTQRAMRRAGSGRGWRGQIEIDGRW